jgi:hypothetical protein
LNVVFTLPYRMSAFICKITIELFREGNRRRDVDPRRRKEENERLKRRWQQIKVPLLERKDHMNNYTPVI